MCPGVGLHLPVCNSYKSVLWASGSQFDIQVRDRPLYSLILFPLLWGLKHYTIHFQEVILKYHTSDYILVGTLHFQYNLWGLFCLNSYKYGFFPELLSFSIFLSHFSLSLLFLSHPHSIFLSHSPTLTWSLRPWRKQNSFCLSFWYNAQIWVETVFFPKPSATQAVCILTEFPFLKLGRDKGLCCQLPLNLPVTPVCPRFCIAGLWSP